MKAVCPKNPKHKKFITTAHVMQLWVVDEHGEFIRCEDECMEVTNGPDPCNTWTCAICLEEARVEG